MFPPPTTNQNNKKDKLNIMVTLHEKTAWALAVLQSSRTTAAAPSALSATLLRDPRLLRGAAGGGPQPSAASLTWGEARGSGWRLGGQEVQTARGRSCSGSLGSKKKKTQQQLSLCPLFIIKTTCFSTHLVSVCRLRSTKWNVSTWSFDDGCLLGEFRGALEVEYSKPKWDSNSFVTAGHLSNSKYYYYTHHRSLKNISHS